MIAQDPRCHCLTVTIPAKMAGLPASSQTVICPECAAYDDALREDAAREAEDADRLERESRELWSTHDDV